MGVQSSDETGAPAPQALASEPQPGLPVTVGALVVATERLYPPDLAESWDRIGLVAGARARQVTKVMVAVDPSPEVAAEAANWGAQLLLVHHPLMLHGVHAIPADEPPGDVLALLIENRCALLTAHTNADAANPGVSDAIAARLGLVNVRPLSPAPAAGDVLMIVYVPKGHVDAVIDAAAAAGAGTIGDYLRCAFTHEGVGTFEAPADGRPFVGQPGERGVAEELRVEMVVPANRRSAVETAVRDTHPYQEPAYHFAVLSAAAAATDTGIGRVGELSAQMTLGEFADYVAAVMPYTAAGIKVAGDLDQTVRTVALCGGSGDSLLSTAAGYDVYVTSDLRHHRVLDHLASGGCPVIDIPHWAAERPWCDQVVELLPTALSGLGFDADSVEFRTSTLTTDPWSAHRRGSQ